MNKWLVALVFVTCVGVVLWESAHEPSVVQLLILAGLVVGYIDRQRGQHEIKSIANGRMDQLLAEAKSAAYAEGREAGRKEAK